LKRFRTHSPHPAKIYLMKIISKHITVQTAKHQRYGGKLEDRKKDTRKKCHT
jgi:hypothetical protein